jgi:hypothetical protein
MTKIFLNGIELFISDYKFDKLKEIGLVNALTKWFPYPRTEWCGLEHISNEKYMVILDMLEEEPDKITTNPVFTNSAGPG